MTSGDTKTLTFPAISDPDLLDHGYIKKIDFGTAKNFITNLSSSYLIKPPINNLYVGNF
jgi:hypothetical protein